MTADSHSPPANAESPELIAQLKMISSALGIAKLAALAEIDQLSEEEMLGWFLIIRQSRQDAQGREQAQEVGRRLLAQLKAELPQDGQGPARQEGSPS